MPYFTLVILNCFGSVFANTFENPAELAGLNISLVVNTAIQLVALTITPVCLAMISKIRPFILPKTVILFILVLLSIIYGAMVIAVLALLILRQQHTPPGIS